MGRRRTGKSSRGGAPSRPRRQSWSWRLVAFLIAVLAVKLTIVFQLRHHPLLQPDGGLDTAAYMRLAAQVAGGDLALGPGLYYLSPLYIYFLAVARIVTDSLTFVRVVQAALGTAAVACVFWTARTWYGERAALDCRHACGADGRVHVLRSRHLAVVARYVPDGGGAVVPG